ncbi:MAG: DUF7192 family protein, partial [Rhizomicrobium sp.]
MIVRYDSTAALRAAYMANYEVASRFNQSERRSWYGGETEKESLVLAETGDTRLVAEAEKAFAALEMEIETPRRQWERSPAGSWCCVPDVLVGLPTPMRRQVHVYDEAAPITILPVTTSSAGINAETLAKRGTVILALVMALARVRPVSLHQVTMLDGKQGGETVITSEINT